MIPRRSGSHQRADIVKGRVTGNRGGAMSTSSGGGNSGSTATRSNLTVVAR